MATLVRGSCMHTNRRTQGYSLVGLTDYMACQQPATALKPSPETMHSLLLLAANRDADLADLLRTATVQSPNKPNSFMGIGWSLYESLTKERSVAVCRFVLHHQRKAQKKERRQGNSQGRRPPIGPSALTPLSAHQTNKV